MLPTDHDIPLSDGETTVLLTESVGDLGHGATVGRPVDGGFEDLASITTLTAVDTSAGWTEGRHGGYPTWTFDSGLMTWVAQDRGEWWVSVYSGPDRIDAVDDLLDNLVVSFGGEIAPAHGSTRVIIEQSRIDSEAIESTVAHYSAALGDYEFPNAFVMTSATSGNSLLNWRADRVEPTTINGVRAWRAYYLDEPFTSESGDAGSRTVVEWKYTPNRTVQVGSSIDVETLERFAGSLVEVAADEWGAALPGFTAECTLEDAALCAAMPNP